MLELTSQADLLKTYDDSSSEPSKNALVREAQLIYEGVAATPKYLLEAFNGENRLSTAQTAAVAAAATAVLSCLKRSPSLSWTSTRVLAPAFSLALIKDVGLNAENLAFAVADNWHSDKNWQQNREIVREGIGKFSADFAIAAVAGGITDRAARSYFELKTPGVKSLPELNRQNLLANWQKHMEGEIIPYRINSPGGGGLRQVDLFLPSGFKMPAEGAPRSGVGLLIAQDGLKLDFGVLRNLKPPEHGLVNLKNEPGLDFVAAYAHPKKFRVLPGVNLSAWHHQGGLIKDGSWLAPKVDFSDVKFIADLEKTLSGMLRTRATTIAGFSSGAILGNEVAAKLGPTRIESVISVASTVTGKEPPARPGQFRLFVRDNGDPTLPQEGSAGVKARMLPRLGHKSILESRPSEQISYALAPYRGHQVEGSASHYPAYRVQSYVHADGTPLVSEIRTNTGRHIWTSRNVAPAEPLKGSKQIAPASPDIISAPGYPATSRHELPDLNTIVKEVVNGNLQRFKISKH